MFKEYLINFLKFFVPFSFMTYLFWIFWGAIFYRNTPILIIATIIFVFLMSYLAHKNLSEKYQKQINKIRDEMELAIKETKLWKDTLIEKTSGFPTLLKFIKEYGKAKDEKLANILASKNTQQ